MVRELLWLLLVCGVLQHLHRLWPSLPFILAEYRWSEPVLPWKTRFTLILLWLLPLSLRVLIVIKGPLIPFRFSFIEDPLLLIAVLNIVKLGLINEVWRRGGYFLLHLVVCKELGLGLLHHWSVVGQMVSREVRLIKLALLQVVLQDLLLLLRWHLLELWKLVVLEYGKSLLVIELLLL